MPCELCVRAGLGSTRTRRSVYAFLMLAVVIHPIQYIVL